MRGPWRGTLRDTSPGAPSIVIKNMPGAGSVLAANHLYNVSPKDGSELGVIAGSAALEPVFGGKGAQFEGQKFTWLGSANEEVARLLRLAHDAVPKPPRTCSRRR